MYLKLEMTSFNCDSIKIVEKFKVDIFYHWHAKIDLFLVSLVVKEFVDKVEEALSLEEILKEQ